VRMMVTMFDETGERSRSHGLTPDVVAAQADRLGLAIISERCSWETYEVAFGRALAAAAAHGCQHVIFGDIFEDSHRAWTERLATAAGLVAHQPLWGEPTSDLVREFLDRGGHATIVTVNDRWLEARWLGQPLSAELIGQLTALGVGAVIVVALVVVLIALLGGGSSKKSSTGSAASGGSATGTSSTASTTGTGTASTSSTTPKAQVVGQSNLNPPSGGQAKGVGFVVKEGTAYGIVIEAAHVAPNSHNAYAAWLYNSATDAYRLGFVNPAVGKNGQLQVGSPLPSNASHYKKLLLTLETQSNPKSPGTIVLEGPFALTSTTK